MAVRDVWPIVIDRDQGAVAAAELAAFDGTDLEERRPFDAIDALIRRLTADLWWPSGPVGVRKARADAQSSTTRCAVSDDDSLRASIRLAGPQMTVATAAHELGHVLAGVGHGHDATFRCAYLDVVFVMTNMDSTDRRHDVHKRQLADAFAAHDLTVGDREWAPPPPSIGSAFAL